MNTHYARLAAALCVAAGCVASCSIDGLPAVLYDLSLDVPTSGDPTDMRHDLGGSRDLGRKHDASVPLDLLTPEDLGSSPDLNESPDGVLAQPDLGLPLLWTRQLGTPDDDGVHGVATASAARIYVTGYTAGGIDGHQSTGGIDIVLVAYDGAGQKRWSIQTGTAGWDWGNGVTTDSAGNVYVVGFTDGGLGGNQNAGGLDVILISYDSGGNLRWLKQFGTPKDDSGLGVAVDRVDNLYVVGTTQGGLDGNQNAGWSDAFVISFDKLGNKRWTRQFGTVKADGAYGVATDGAGNVFVVGSTDGGLDGNPNAGSSDAFVVSYDSAGNRRWSRQFGTPEWDEPGKQLAIDGAANLYVPGYTAGGLDGNQNAGLHDMFVISYDGAGNKRWTRQLGTADQDWGVGAVTDGAGNCYVSGYTGGGLDGNQSDGADDFFVVKYDSAGNKRWTRQHGSGGGEFAPSIATDGMGALYVAGSTRGSLDGNQNAGSWDMFLTKLSSSP